MRKMEKEDQRRSVAEIRLEIMKLLAYKACADNEGERFYAETRLRTLYWVLNEPITAEKLGDPKPR